MVDPGYPKHVIFGTQPDDPYLTIFGPNGHILLISLAITPIFGLYLAYMPHWAIYGQIGPKTAISPEYPLFQGYSGI